MNIFAVFKLLCHLYEIITKDQISYMYISSHILDPCFGYLKFCYFLVYCDKIVWSKLFVDLLIS